MGKKFVASFSGGKDSTLAIYKAIGQGHELIALITTYNIDENRSWSHGLSKSVLERVAESLGAPSWVVETTGEKYAENFEKVLIRAKEHGAEMCVFGDTDIEGHLHWGEERCQEVGIEAMFPLWGKGRESVVYEFIDSGFTANISVIDTSQLDDIFLGEKLTKTIAIQIAEEGADICGENGEYHTFASDGPIFSYPINFSFGEKVVQEKYSILPIE